MDHLLTCECGRGITVTRKQAGQELECECGRRLTVPTLRGLQQLPPAETVEETGPVASSSEVARSSWSGWRGPVFALTVAVFLIAAGTTITFALQRSSIDTSYNADREIAEGEKVIDEYTPVELSLTWNDYQKFDFGQKMLPPFFVMAKIAEKLDRYIMIGGSVCAVSALIAAGVWFSTRRRKL